MELIQNTITKSSREFSVKELQLGFHYRDPFYTLKIGYNPAFERCYINRNGTIRPLAKADKNASRIDERIIALNTKDPIIIKTELYFFFEEFLNTHSMRDRKSVV